MNMSRDSSPLETLVQAIGVGLAGVSADGRQTFVNEAFCKIVGYPADVLVGALPPFCYWSEHTRKDVLASLDLALKGVFPSAGKRLIFRRKSGQEFPALVHVSATTGPGETAWLSTVVDLSQLEERAIKAERQSQTLLDAQKLARLGTWEVRGEGVILSNTTRKLLRVPPTMESVGLQDVLGRIAAADRLRLTDKLRETGAFESELQFCCFDESKAWLKLAGSYFSMGSDEVVLRGSVIDITKRKAAELERQAAIDRFSRALVVGKSVLVEVDLSGKVKYFSDDSGMVFGLAAGTTVGRRIGELITSHAALPAFLRVETWDAAAGIDGPIDVQVIGVPGKDPVPAIALPEVVYLNGEKLLRLVLVNMSDYRMLEKQTELLQRRQLLGQLTAELTHNFANVLAIIQMHADQAILGDAEAVPKELSIIKTAAERGAVIGRSLLAAAQDRPLAVKTIDLAARLQSLKALIKITLGPMVDLDLSCDDAGWVALDPGAFDSALTNLCINARDSFRSKSGRVRIVISRRKAALEHLGRLAEACVVVDVVDNGSGMEPDILRRVFEPFFTTKESGRGTGLGLPSVLAFARASGGDVVVHSKPGCGTTVSMIFPEVAADVIAPPCLAGSARQTRPARILVVDDEQDLLSAVRECLDRAGHAVVASQSGEEAMQVLTREQNFDLMLTDMALPGKFSGVNLSILARQQHPDIKIIFMSGFAGRFRERPDWPVLDKPFSGEEVLKAVADSLRDYSATPASDPIASKLHSR